MTWKTKITLLFIGQAFSLLTSGAVSFAITMRLTLETGSAEVLAYATISALLPTAIIAPFAGVFIDRWNKKYVMMIADSLVAIFTLIMAFAFIYGYVDLNFIYFMLAIRAIASAFHFPSLESSIPMLIPESELLRISGVNQIIQASSSIFGPAIGGLSIAIFPSIGQVLFLDVVGAILAVGFLFFVVFPKTEKYEKKMTCSQIFVEMKEGFQAVLENKGVATFFFYGLFLTFFVVPFITILPLMTKKHFGGGAEELTIIETLFAVGMLLGGFIISIFNPKTHKMIIQTTSLIIFGILVFISGFLPSTKFYFYVFVFIMTITGIISSVYNSTFMAFLQERIQISKLGKVMSLNFSIGMFPSIIGLLWIGLITDYVGGVTNMFIYLGIIFFVLGILIFFTPSIRKMIREDKERIKNNIDK
ncbi:hypothetical protein BLD25_05070 [Candidatus Gracilibacteria bacterium GN02-872]|nr:hypothetical protein BLD25_05070 [Candidatus Gracilibacteria bacterium GN02-872]